MTPRRLLVICEATDDGRQTATVAVDLARRLSSEQLDLVCLPDGLGTFLGLAPPALGDCCGAAGACISSLLVSAHDAHTERRRRLVAAVRCEALARGLEFRGRLARSRSTSEMFEAAHGCDLIVVPKRLLEHSLKRRPFDLGGLLRLVDAALRPVWIVPTPALDIDRVVVAASCREELRPLSDLADAWALRAAAANDRRHLPHGGVPREDGPRRPTHRDSQPIEAVDGDPGANDLVVVDHQHRPGVLHLFRGGWWLRLFERADGPLLVVPSTTRRRHALPLPLPNFKTESRNSKRRAG